MNITDIKGTVRLSNGVEMPYLGLGVYKAEDGTEVERAINYAFDAGYRHIDTASYYNNEEGVGEAIKKSNIDRKNIFVTTKVWPYEQKYENTLKAFDLSMKKLQLDYLDLYLIHWPMPELYLEAWKAMEKLYKEGRIKAIGVCNCLEHHIDAIIQKYEIKPMVNQIEFHPRLVQPELLEYCKKHDIQLEAWSPLMRGKIFEIKELGEIAKKYNKSVAQIVLRWDLQKGFITIPKSVNNNRIISNADIFDFEISKEDMNFIDSLDKEERTGAHPDHFIEHFNRKK